MIGIDGVIQADGSWTYPSDYTPYSKPVMIDATKRGFANRGHEREVEGLNDAERTDLIEYLKLL